MVATNLNESNFHGHTFKGFVQFQNTTDATPAVATGLWYRLKERQNMSFNMNFNRSNHYADDGTLVLDPSGHSHSFNMTIKLTSDMFDNVFSVNSSKKTLSYWIYQNTVNNPIEIIFVTSFDTLTGPTSNPNENSVNIKFVLDPSSFSTGLSSNGGSPEISISGAVKSITTAVRHSTKDQ